MRTYKKLSILFLMAFHLSVYIAQDDDVIYEEDNYSHLNYKAKKGFMYGLNIGLLLANNEPALFYNGSAPNNIYNYLSSTNSNSYTQISNYVGNYNFHLVELPEEMDYKPAVSFGLNLRYQKNWTNAFVADLNYSQLNASGLVVIEVERPNTSGATQANYEYFPIYGKETRLVVSAGYQITLTDPSSMGLIFEFGPVLTSVKVNRNAFRVGDREYNILRPQLSTGGQYINRKQPTVNDFGGYAAVGFNVEFDKFTIDALFRTSLERIQFDPNQEAKHKLQFLPHLRFSYRLLK